MNETNLHSSRLERLVGKISCELISQEGEIRKVHLLDSKGISKTLGIVKFYEVQGAELQNAHRRIVSGELLGKTLFDANIDFKKTYQGHVPVVLPEWLQNDFDTGESSSIALCSKIYINSHNGQEHNVLYANIIEVIPPTLLMDFLKVAPPLAHTEKDIEILFNASGIMKLNTN